MKIGVLVDSFQKGFKTGVETAASLGLQGIQAYLNDGEMAVENLSATKISEVKKILSDNNIELAAVCGDAYFPTEFMIKEENPKRIERMKMIMQKTKELGGNIVTSHAGVIPEDDTMDRYKTLQEAFAKLGAIAEEIGVYFSIETGMETAPVLKKFLSSLGCKNVKVNLDPANFVMVSKQDPVEAVHLLKDYIVSTHAKDGKCLKYLGVEKIYNPAPGLDRSYWSECFIETPLGEGEIDWNAYINALKQIDYDGYLTIEREVGDDPTADITLAANLLKNLI